MRRHEAGPRPLSLPAFLATALLPDQPTGCYPECTVLTPGEGDRGARRIVTGRNGERYWTDDHNGSFSGIIGTGTTTSQGA